MSELNLVELNESLNFCLAREQEDTPLLLSGLIHEKLPQILRNNKDIQLEELAIYEIVANIANEISETANLTSLKLGEIMGKIKSLINKNLFVYTEEWFDFSEKEIVENGETFDFFNPETAWEKETSEVDLGEEIEN